MLPRTDSRKHDLDIAVVSRIFAPEPGAASLRLSALVAALLDAGARVTVLTVHPPRQFAGEAGSGGDDRLRIRRAPVLRDRAGYVRGYLQYLSFDLLLAFRLLFLSRPDVVVVEPPPTTGLVVRLVCGLRRIPYVYYAADVWSDAVASTQAPRVVQSLLRAVEVAASRGARRVLSASEEFSERLSELGAGLEIVTVGSGVDLTQFSAEGTGRDLGAPYFLYAGTASEVHGATIFLEAFARVHGSHPEAKLVFVGQGSDWPTIQETARAFPDGAISVLPRHSPAEVAEWFRGARASLASVKPGGYERAFPTKMYASVACGTEVIFTGAGPGRRFAESSGSGWCAEYLVDAVAAAMTAALESAPSDEARRKLARWAAENVSLQVVAQRGAREILGVIGRLGAR